MPVVGKRYKLKNRNMIVRVLPIVTVVEEGIGGTIEYGVEVFNDIYEELPEDNLQEKKEVSEVERALEELKKELSKPCYTLEEANTAKEEHLIRDLAYTAYAAQNLVKALEAEKQKEPTINCSKIGDRVINHYHSKKIEPKIFVDQGKVGGDYTAKARVSKDENGNFVVHEIVIEEPKIDMKEECVEPVSIWNLTRDLKDRCYFSSYQIWLYEIFINSFEQMQKDIEEIKRK